jgi:hypothetical protein
MFMKKLVVLLAALLPSFASAGDFWGAVNLASIHGKTKKSLNQRNLGLGLEYHQSSDIIYLVGAYDNSHRGTTGYALAGWTPIHWQGAKLGLVGGIANGYPKHNNGGVFPLLSGLVRIEGDRWGMNLFVIPPAVKGTPLTAGFQVKYRF